MIEESVTIWRVVDSTYLSNVLEMKLDIQLHLEMKPLCALEGANIVQVVVVYPQQSDAFFHR